MTTQLGQPISGTPAERLRDLAEWAGVMGHWLEQLARHPNDEDEPQARTVRFPDARSLDSFLTALREVGGELEVIAKELAQRPSLRAISGGRNAP